MQRLFPVAYALLVGACVFADTVETLDTTLLRKSCADPWLFRHDGKFYLTQTGAAKVRVLASDTLAGLAAADCAQSIAYDSAGDPTVKALGYAGVSGTWSPEIHCFTDADFPGHAGWYMFLALRDSAPGDARHVKSVVLKSLSGKPAGPYGHPVTGEKFASQLVLDKNGQPYADWAVGQSALVIRTGAWKGVYALYVTEKGRGTRDFYQEIRIARLKAPWQLATASGIVTVPTQFWETVGASRTAYRDPEKKKSAPYFPRVVEGATAVYGDKGDVYLISGPARTRSRPPAGRSSSSTPSSPSPTSAASTCPDSTCRGRATRASSATTPASGFSYTTPIPTIPRRRRRSWTASDSRPARKASAATPTSSRTASTTESGTVLPGACSTSA